ncbi:hypothetical protein LshimejAT787_2100070 [Lyophyllum shimeji]|uniref:Uncharacterized protein n=1 Tax=Lyophyllum shimeji TaxID=47721 RepID=A0A9P3PY81_LYOSH|nr:hypothetical protein LshimejAT787_2100070 [Lyophyllum shimeji]
MCNASRRPDRNAIRHGVEAQSSCCSGICREPPAAKELYPESVNGVPTRHAPSDFIPCQTIIESHISTGSDAHPPVSTHPKPRKSKKQILCEYNVPPGKQASTLAVPVDVLATGFWL